MSKTAPKRKAALVLASYSLKKVSEGDSLFIRCDSEMTSKEKLSADGKTNAIDDKTGEPVIITTVMVTDILTGESGEMVVPFVVKKAFDTIVKRDKNLKGHAFELVKGKKVNRTNEWSVYEVEAA